MFNLLECGGKALRDTALDFRFRFDFARPIQSGVAQSLATALQKALSKALFLRSLRMTACSDKAQLHPFMVAFYGNRSASPARRFSLNSSALFNSCLPSASEPARSNARPSWK